MTDFKLWRSISFQADVLAEMARRASDEVAPVERVIAAKEVAKHAHEQLKRMLHEDEVSARSLASNDFLSAIKGNQALVYPFPQRVPSYAPSTLKEFFVDGWHQKSGLRKPQVVQILKRHSLVPDDMSGDGFSGSWCVFFHEREVPLSLEVFRDLCPDAGEVGGAAA